MAPVIGTKAVLRDAIRTKSGLVGFAMLLLLLGVAVVVPILAPSNVVRSWTDVAAWTDNPRNAAPEWTDVFTGHKSSKNIVMSWDDFSSAESNTSPNFKIVLLRARWTIPFDTFPSELRLQLLVNWADRRPLVTVVWQRPDDEQLTLYNAAPMLSAPNINTISLSSDPDVVRQVREWARNLGANDTANVRPQATLHAVVGPDMLNANRAQILRGTYTLTIQAIMFNLSDTIKARYTSYGAVFGLVGTDSWRRDLLIGILWGAPVALAFGAAAATITLLSQVILGALGAYYGRRFDEVIQRVTDFAIIIPALPILILIGYLYQPNTWLILLIVIVFNLAGGTTKVIRSIALQVKEELYIESARAYGASRRRILFRYIIPRTMPYTFALLSLNVPSFIFLQASLAVLGVGEPDIPTWGGIMGDALRNGAIYNGFWWWITFPASGIVFATVAFAFLGYAFDKVLNPRLREE